MDCLCNPYKLEFSSFNIIAITSQPLPQAMRLNYK
jgi:hypothetical protein